MIKLNYANIFEFCKFASSKYDDIYDNDIFNTIGIVAKYEEATYILEWFISKNYLIDTINIENPENDGYDGEYAIRIDEGAIFCSPIREHGKYRTVQGNIVFVLDNCSSVVLSKIKADCMFEVAIGECAKSDEKKTECAKKDSVTSTEKKVVPTKEEKPMAKKTEKYTVNGKEVDKKVYDEAKSEIVKRFEVFDDSYVNAVRNALLLRCAYMDFHNNTLRDFL